MENAELSRYLGCRGGKNSSSAQRDAGVLLEEVTAKLYLKKES